MNLNEVSTDALAFLGDAVIEIRVREYLVKAGVPDSATLNQNSVSFVSAAAQAEAMRRILDELSEEEALIYKRGRNSSTGNVPKRAKMADYRCASGMEVLFGYLHLCGRYDRLDLLFKKAYNLQSER